MNSPAFVRKACSSVAQRMRRQHTHWRVVCPPKIPRVSLPGIAYVGGAVSTSDFRAGYGLAGLGSVYPTIDGYGHWTFESGSPLVLHGVLHPTDAIGRPQTDVSPGQLILMSGQAVRLFRVAPGFALYGGHVVVEWIDRGQEYQVSVHRWRSDNQGVRQAIAMAAAIILQLKQSRA